MINTPSLYERQAQPAYTPQATCLPVRPFPGHPAGTYLGIGSNHWISKNIDHGALIQLEDKSIWEISSLDKLTTALWLPVSNITVIENSNPFYPYRLVNSDDGESAEAKLISR
jgi:hypothetical protein